MSPLLPPPRMRQCSAPSRSFLLGPNGPAGAAPGQNLRSGALIGQGEPGTETRSAQIKVSTVRGEPRLGVLSRLMLDTQMLLSGPGACLALLGLTHDGLLWLYLATL